LYQLFFWTEQERLRQELDQQKAVNSKARNSGSTKAGASKSSPSGAMVRKDKQPPKATSSRSSLGREPVDKKLPPKTSLQPRVAKPNRDTRIRSNVSKVESPPSKRKVSAAENSPAAVVVRVASNKTSGNNRPPPQQRQPPAASELAEYFDDDTGNGLRLVGRQVSGDQAVDEELHFSQGPPPRSNHVPADADSGAGYETMDMQQAAYATTATDRPPSFDDMPIRTRATMSAGDGLAAGDDDPSALPPPDAFAEKKRGAKKRSKKKKHQRNYSSASQLSIDSDVGAAAGAGDPGIIDGRLRGDSELVFVSEAQEPQEEANVDFPS